MRSLQIIFNAKQTFNSTVARSQFSNSYNVNDNNKLSNNADA